MRKMETTDCVGAFAALHYRNAFKPIIGGIIQDVITAENRDR